VIARLLLFRWVLDTEHGEGASDSDLVRPINRQTGPQLEVSNWKRQLFGSEIRRRLSMVIPLCEMGNPLELSVQGCLESLGVSLLIDWDVLIFVFHHGVTLSSADQMARCLCWESTRIGNALGRLESLMLIETSRRSRGVRFYRVVVSPEGSRQSCFQQLLSLTGNRAGRLMLAKILKPDTRETVPEERAVHLF
jgi:hypothetical protein